MFNEVSRPNFQYDNLELITEYRVFHFSALSLLVWRQAGYPSVPTYKKFGLV